MTRARVAIVYDCLFPFTKGGGERLYRSYAELLSRRGFDVDYLTSRQWDGEAPVVADFTVVPVSRKLELYDSDGVRRFAAAIVFALAIFRALLTRRGRYGAVVVSGLPVLNVFAARVALLGSSTTLVVDYLEVWTYTQWREYAGGVVGTVAWILQRAAVRMTPIATCHSELTARRLDEDGFRGRLLVSPGLIEDGAHSTAVSMPARPPYVLYAGRHIQDKRVECLPEAVDVARKTIPDLRLVILGDGPSGESVRSAVSRVSGEPWTELPGFVSQEALDRYMGEAACLANPSRREGYGLVVVEAAGHGTPVVLVADEGNAATELVTPNVNGFVAESTAPAELGAAIVAAITAGDPLRASARTWYEDAVQTRTVGKTVDQLVEALADVDDARRITPSLKRRR